MDDTRENLLLFFDRPTEPIFMTKGDDKKRFNIPKHYYPEEFKNLLNTPRANLQGPPEGSIINVADISLPDLSLPMKLHRDEQFSFFMPKHRQMAGKLIDIFMSMRNLKELQSVFAYCHPRINPYMFNYCASVAILHRPDTKRMDIPTFAETFPDKFVDRKSLRRAREYCTVFPEGTELPIITNDLPVNPKNLEQRMAYFHEDIGINSHHWHWHLIYPTDATDSHIVKKDRRGELFYYMHHQMLARYNVERMCNGLERTKPYDNFREPIADGYFPLLDSGNSSRAYMPRYDHTSPVDITRSDHNVNLSDMETWRHRILAAIEYQSVLQVDGSQSPLDEETGIDVLGNLVEASCLSYNHSYYGDYHNMGHIIISYVHDPNERHAQQFSVMGDTATAMRDPVFYRWHTCIDDIFTFFKDKLKPYGPDELFFRDIHVSSISIEGGSGQNTINTQWERNKLNLRNGLDFAPRRDVYVEFTHLQHKEFNYVIEVNNTSRKTQVGTIRIFLAPTVDESGQSLSFEEQRKLVIEMDKFSQSLSPGNNTVRRSSVKSSVTIPFERIFRKHDGPCDSPPTPNSNFCDCGWPQYLLVPKGTIEGYPMVVFVMISNWNEDKIDGDRVGADHDNASYCGLRDHKYPDRRAMGFPFDRKSAGIDSLDQFLQPNMAIRNCTIKFTDIIGDVNQPEESHRNVGGEATLKLSRRSGDTGRPQWDRTGLGGSRCSH